MPEPNVIQFEGGAEIVIDPAGTPFTINETLGPITLTVSQALAQVMINNYGNLPWTEITTGFDGPPKLAFQLTNTVSATLVEIFGVTIDTLEHQIRNSVGEDLRETSKLVLLKPAVNGVATTDPSAWIVFPLMSKMVLTATSVAFAGAGGSQRAFAVEMHAYPVDHATPPVSIGYNVPI